MSEHPFTTPAESEADMFIQWKGTNVCLDFTCGECGRGSHLDADFAHFVRCGCGAVYEMGTQVIAKRVAGIGDANVLDLDMDSWRTGSPAAVSSAATGLADPREASRE